MCRIRLAAFLLIGTTSLVGQGLQDRDRTLGRSMLQQIKKDIQKEYYDPSFGGIDLDAHFAQANEKVLQAVSLGQMMGIIGQALVDFNDSHTRFIPPARVHRHSLGAGAVVMYGANITNADVIMSNGGRLEHSGVTPDELLIPSQEDLAAGRDPVMARAVALIGYELSPEEEHFRCIGVGVDG